VQFGRTGSLPGLKLLAIALVSCFPSYSAVRAAELTPIHEPEKPDFYLQDINHRNVSLNAFKGRTVLVHFIATWCEPCREELPALNRFLRRSVPNAFAVAVPVTEVDRRVARFLERSSAEFRVLLDRDGAVAKSWKISTLPTTYVLDANMKSTFVVEANFPWDTVDVAPATGKLVNNEAGEIKTTSEQP
jgi:thiol-disulfide isomerase/thioredoxin